MSAQSYANLVVIDCAPICGQRSLPSGRIEHFGKTKDEIERAIGRAQAAYNAGFKMRRLPGLGNKLILVALLGIAPLPLMFFGGIAMNALATIGVPIPTFNEWSDDHRFAVNVLMWVFMASLLLFALGLRLQARASAVLANDPRPPVLLLRSFADEARAPMAQDRVGGLALYGLITLVEEKLGLAVAGMGPFIAIGLPGEQIAYRGAGRAYYSNAEWQEAVLGFMQASRCILLLAGNSSALIWELEQIVTRGYLDKTVIVLPPEHDAAICARRWDVLVRLLPALSRANPGLADCIGAIYHVRGSTVLVAGAGLTVADYADMMRVPLYDLYCRGSKRELPVAHG